MQAPAAFVEQVSVPLVVPRDVVLHHRVAGDDVEVVAPSVPGAGPHVVRLAVLDGHVVGVPGPDSHRPARVRGVRQVPVLVLLGVFDHAPGDAPDHDAAAGVMPQSRGAVVVVGQRVADVDVLVRPVPDVVGSDADPLAGDVVDHDIRHANVAQGRSRVRIDLDAGALEVRHLDVVDLEAGVANRLRQRGVDFGGDGDSVLHGHEVVVVGRAAVPPDHQGGDLDVVQVLDHDARMF